jgi:transglutaminase-like putative cysteine protease
MPDQIQSEYVKRPQPYHLVLFALYGVTTLQALWQHGHPEFTFAVLSLIAVSPVVGYVPDSVFPLHHRRLAQGLAAAVGFVWVGWRYTNNVPADLALIEGLAAISLAFAFSRKAEEFDYVLLVAVIMLGYGAVAPPRHCYLLLMPISVFLAMIALYQSRTSALARRSFGFLQRQYFASNWQTVACHAVTFALLWGILFVLFPASRRHGPGLVGVSYETSNANILAPRLQSWLPSSRYRSDSLGPMEIEGKNAQAHDPNASTLVQGEWQKPATQGSGGGAGTPSDALVMRVKSPVRLYWVGRIYDRYDGRAWQYSKPRRNDRKRIGGTQPTVIPQTFVIENWVSRSLFAAYKPIGFGAPREYRAAMPKEEHEWGRRFRDDQPMPPIPFQYSVRSYVRSTPQTPVSPIPGLTLSKPPEPQGASRRLPKKVPIRVRKLALEIAGSIEDPLAKALALRDHLRNSYKYEQYSAKTPLDREPVDYFLFDLDRGHCEYFAAALAVLARANKMSSRVVTGFSPGDYNALTGCFEVKESHAHAWTQIYVPEYGWLTFDATPPGVVESRVTPGIIGMIRDPFSDDWQVNPPELSQDVTDFRKQTQHYSAIPATGADGKPAPVKLSLSTQIAMNIPTNFSEAKTIWRRWTRKTRDADGQQTTRLAKAIQTITTNLKAMVSKTIAIAKNVAAALTPARMALVLICGALIAGITYAIRVINQTLTRRRRLRRCKDWWRQARKVHEAKPAQSIQYSYRVIRELLALAGLPKPAGDDLQDYARSLNRQLPAVSHDALAVFDLYALVRYSQQAPTSRESRAALMRASCAREELLKRLNEKQ